MSVALRETAFDPPPPPAAVAAVAVDLPLTAVAQAGAAWALGYAIQLLSKPQWSFGAWGLLALAVALGVAGLVLPRSRLAARLPPRALEAVLGGALLHQWLVMLFALPGPDLPAGTDLVPFRIGVVIAGVLIAAIGWGKGRWAFPALLAVHVAIGVWILRAMPAPHIDVFTWHNEALDLLSAGKNPYAATMPDLYGNPAILPPGYLVNGRVLTGYPYPPLELGLAWIGRTLVGDFRAMHLLAMVAAGALIGYTRPGRRAYLAAAVFLFTPRAWCVLERAWNDAYLALFLALAVFLAVRGWRRIAWPLGLLFAVKQHMLLLVGAVPLLFGGHWRRAVPTIVGALAIGAAVTLPVALLDPQAFWHSVVAVPMKVPFRPDSLSFLSLWYWKLSDHVVPPSWLGFVTVLPAAWLLWRYVPRTESGFAGTTAFLYLVFFAFGKQAFTNYYWFVIGALCVAVAAAAPARGR